MKDKKSKYLSFEGTKENPIFGGKKTTETRDNPLYSPGKRPNWCIKKFKDKEDRVPEFKCLCNNKGEKCPFFMYGNVDKKDYEFFMLAYHVFCETVYNTNNFEFNKKSFKLLKYKMLNLIEDFNDEDNYSVFVECLGNTEIIKVLSYILCDYELDFAIEDIAEDEKMNVERVDNVIKHLLKQKIIIKSRVDKKIQLYKCNIKSKITLALKDVFDEILIKHLDQKHNKRVDDFEKKNC